MNRNDVTKVDAPSSVTAQVTRGDRRLSFGKIKTFSSLANPVFRLYYFGGVVCHMASTQMQQVTNPLLAYRLTGSAALLGVVALAGVLPHIFFSLFGGVIADRMQKKHILLIAMGAFTIVASGLALSLSFGILNKNTWWLLIIIQIFHTSLTGFMIPARHAIIREIVGKEGIMNAVALNTLATGTFTLMGPAAAGFVIDAFGFQAVYFLMAGFNALGFLLLLFMPLTSKISASSETPWQNVREGFRYIRNEPNILFVCGFILVGVIFAMPYQQLMAVFVDDILKVGAKGMGILRSVSGVGGIAGSLVLASLPSKRRGLMLLLGTMLFGLSLIVFAFSKSWALSLAIMVFVGIGQMTRQTLGNVLAQSYTTDQYRGRVMGVYDMEMSFTGLGVYVAGVMTEATNSVEWTVGGFAMFLVFICVIALVFARRIRNLD